MNRWSFRTKVAIAALVLGLALFALSLTDSQAMRTPTKVAGRDGFQPGSIGAPELLIVAGVVALGFVVFRRKP